MGTHKTEKDSDASTPLQVSFDTAVAPGQDGGADRLRFHRPAENDKDGAPATSKPPRYVRHRLLAGFALSAGAAWIVAAAAYVAATLGWSQIDTLLPLEIARMAGFMVAPLVLLGLAVGAVERGRHRRHDAKTLRWYLDQLVYPDAASERRLRDIRDSLHRQADDLNAASDNAARRAGDILDALRQRTTELSEAADHAEARARETADTLRRQSEDLVSQSDRAISRAREAGNVLHHQALDLITVSRKATTETEALSTRLKQGGDALIAAAADAAARSRDTADMLRDRVAEVQTTAAGAMAKADGVAGRIQDGATTLITAADGADHLEKRLRRTLENTQGLRDELSAQSTQLDAATARVDETARRAGTVLREGIGDLDQAAARLGAAENDVRERYGALRRDADRAMADVRTWGATIEARADQIGGVATRIGDAATDLGAAGAGLADQATGIEGRLRRAGAGVSAVAGDLAATAAAADAQLQANAANLQRHQTDLAVVSETALTNLDAVAGGLDRRAAAVSTAVEKAARLVTLMTTALQSHGRDIDLVTVQAAAKANQMADALHRVLNELSLTADQTLDHVGALSGSLRDDLDALAGGAAGVVDAMTQVAAQADLSVTRIGDAGETMQSHQDQMALRGDRLRDTLSASIETAAQVGHTLDQTDAGVAKRLADLQTAYDRALRDLGVMNTALEDQARLTRRTVADAGADLDGWEGKMRRATKEIRGSGEAVGAMARDAVRGLHRQTRELDAAGAGATRLLAQLRDHYDKVAIDDFMRQSRLIQEALQSIAVDVSRVMELRLNEDDWKRYLKGDRGIFLRRVLAATQRDAAKKIAGLYRADGDFRTYTDRYVGQFETLIEHAAASDASGGLGAAFMTSDVGRLYALLRHALGKK